MIVEFGYIDPGAGSYVFQLLIAGLSAGTFFFVTMKKRIVNWFRRRPSEDETSAPPCSDVPDEKPR